MAIHPSNYVLVRRTVSLPVHAVEIYPNETLLRNGFLGCSPLTPTVAITIRSLSAYQQMHRTCPRFSIYAFAKMLCHLHNVSLHVRSEIQVTNP